MLNTLYNLILILIFKRGPVDLPYSNGLLILLFLGCIVLGSHYSIELGLLKEVVVEIPRVLLIVWTYMLSILMALRGVLSFYKLKTRFVKTAIAWFWVEFLVSGAKGAVITCYYPMDGFPWAQNAFIFIVFYELFVKGRILQQSLGISWPLGIIYVIGIGLVARIPARLVALI